MRAQLRQDCTAQQLSGVNLRAKWGGVVLRALGSSLIIFMILAGCSPPISESNSEYNIYRAERQLAKLCHDGTRVYYWRDQYWVADGKRWPDLPVKDIAAVCS